MFKDKFIVATKDRRELLKLSFDACHLLFKHQRILHVDDKTHGAQLVVTAATLDSLNGKLQEENQTLNYLQQLRTKLEPKHKSKLSPVSSNVVGDIYRDPWIEEVKLVLPALQELQTQLDALLVEFPENAILQQISPVCQRIINFPITSPVMKILIGLELLLKKAQDWESYASKRVSLKGNIVGVD